MNTPRLSRTQLIVALCIGLISGGACGAWLAAGGGYVAIACAGVILFVVLGLTLGELAHRNQVRLSTATDVNDRAALRRLFRQARRGPLPTEPDERARVLAALRVIRQSPQQFRTSVAIFGILSAVNLFNAVTTSWWFLLGAAVLAIFVPLGILERRSQQRRIAELELPVGGGGRIREP